MEIKVSSTTPLRYTMEITENERFKLANALRHALYYERTVEYDDDWLKKIETMQGTLAQYDEDNEED